MYAADRYYRSSGVVPIAGTSLMFAGGLVAAAVLGIIYGIVCFINPLVYLTALGAVFLGMLIGRAVVFGADRGKVRNPLFVTFVGCVFGAVAVYFAWVGYVFAVTDFMVFTLQPEFLWMMIQFVGALGAWSIGGHTPTGWELYTLWLIEAGVILYFTAATAAGVRRPFCEECGAWTVEEKGIAIASDTDRPALLADLEREQYESLDALRRREIDPTGCLLLTLHTCPRCRESNFLTVEAMSLSANNKGELEQKVTPFVRHLRIPHDVVEQLRTEIEAPAAETETPGDVAASPLA